MYRSRQASLNIERDGIHWREGMGISMNIYLLCSRDAEGLIPQNYHEFALGFGLPK